jgi:hypothetical protein
VDPPAELALRVSVVIVSRLAEGDFASDEAIAVPEANPKRKRKRGQPFSA